MAGEVMAGGVAAAGALAGEADGLGTDGVVCFGAGGGGGAAGAEGSGAGGAAGRPSPSTGGVRFFKWLTTTNATASTMAMFSADRQTRRKEPFRAVEPGLFTPRMVAGSTRLTGAGAGAGFDAVGDGVGEALGAGTGD